MITIAAAPSAVTLVIFAELSAPAASAHEHHSGISETSSEVFRMQIRDRAPQP